MTVTWLGFFLFHPVLPCTLTKHRRQRQWRTEGVGFGGFKPPPPEFRSFDKAELKYVVLKHQKLRKFYYMK
jgi:hypothetical protein